MRPLENPKEPVVYRIWGRSMHAQVSRLPSYRHHKPTGLAVVSIGGRDVYLGKHDSPESRAEYDRIVAEWLARAGRWWLTRPPEPISRSTKCSWRMSIMPTRITLRTVSRRRSRSTSGWLSGLSANSMAILWPVSSGLSGSRQFARP